MHNSGLRINMVPLADCPNQKPCSKDYQEVPWSGFHQEEGRNGVSRHERAPYDREWRFQQTTVTEAHQCASTLHLGSSPHKRFRQFHVLIRETYFRCSSCDASTCGDTLNTIHDRRPSGLCGLYRNAEALRSLRETLRLRGLVLILESESCHPKYSALPFAASAAPRFAQYHP